MVLGSLKDALASLRILFLRNHKAQNEGKTEKKQWVHSFTFSA